MGVQFLENLNESQQLELKTRLEKAETKEAKEAVFLAYAKEQGLTINQVEQTGISIEKTIPDEKNIVKRETTTSINVEDLLKAMQIEDPSAKVAFKEFLAEKNIQIDEQGNIRWTSPEQKNQIEQAISEYNQANMKESIVFEDTDQGLIDKLIQDGTISKNDDGTYSVLNKAKLEEVLKNKESEETEQLPPQEISVTSTSVTETEVEEGIVEPASQDLKHDRAARRQLVADFEVELERWANQPENVSTMNISIAKEKYAKAITKQAAKITKEYNDKKSDVELLKDYYSQYATNEEKKYLDDTMSAIYSLAFDENPNATPEEKENAQNLRNDLLKALQTGTKGSLVKDLSDPADQRNAILYYIMQNGKFDKNALIERMATVDVMGARSDKQVEKDRKEWIKNEAKRQAKAVETDQNIQNTKVHLTKDMRKAAQKGESKDSVIEHTDIGNYGRELFRKCPTFFGEECNVQGDGDFFSDDDGNEYFRAENGKVYKFSEKLLDEFCEYACSGNINKLSPEARERFGVDGNLTLKEGRDILKQQIFRDKDGNPRSIEQLMGNANGSVGNRELNKFRNFIRKNGSSVDTNTTDLKRGLHIAKGVGIGAFLGFGTGFLGSALAGAISFAAQGAQQAIEFSANYNGVTNPQTIHDSTTFEYDINGKTYTKTVNKHITVDGQEYSGTVSGVQEVDGQTVSGQVKQNNWKNAANAAIFGGIAGGVTNALSAGKVEAQGQSFDGVVNLRRTVQHTTDPEEGKLNLNIRRTRTVTVRSGEIGEKIGFKPCKLRVTNVNSTLNRGETMESMVAKYYEVTPGSPEHKALMEEIRKFNHVDKFGGMNYSKGNIFNLPDKIKIGETWFDRKSDPETNRLELDTQDIRLAQGGRYNPKTVSSVPIDTRLRGKGKITRQ